MRCVVPDCKNDSRNNFKSEGITFHSFPMEPSMRKSWLDALGKPDWQPKERSTVCSEHFLPEDLYETPSGLRKVRVGAVPIINQVLNTSCEFGEPVTKKVCRMCLVISHRLFSIKKYNLGHAFERLTGLSLNDEDGLPKNLCAECATRLHNCEKFRERSLRANTLMIDLLKTHEHLTTSTLKCVFEIQTPKLKIKYFTPDHFDLILEHTDLNEVHKLDIDLEIKSLDDEELEIKNETENDEIFADDFSPKDEEISYENFSDTEKLDKAFDTDDSLPLEVAKKKKKKKKEILKEKKVKKIKSTEPKIDRRRKPFLNQDLNETLFTVTDLSVEEQLAEVLKRQDTDNYKHAVFKCVDCFKGFLDRDAYSSHIVRHTNECGEHRCDICKTHFKQSHALRKHVTAHHLQRFSCNNCPYVTTHRQTARLHERWHKGTKYQCPHCNLEFLKFTTYMGHVRIKHPSDCVCELCGYSFVSAKGIELHKKLKHRGEDATIPENGPYCELCDVRFVTADAHRKHLSVSTRHSGVERENNKPTRGRKPRDQDRQPLYGQDNLDHYVTDDLDDLADIERERRAMAVRSNMLARRFARRSRENSKSKDTDDEEKRRTYPSQIRRSEGPISCEQCGMELEDSRAYHGHFRRMHPDKNRTNYPSMKSPCMCEVCGRIFQSYALLRDHNWVHTGERPFKCEQCGKTFRMKQRLVAHRRVHSTARTSYDCTVCGKHFTTHSNRQRHMFIHTGLKPFKCEMCGKGFKHASEKRAHVTYVHLKKPWPKRARSKRHRQGSPVQGSASEADMLPVWPACDPKLTDINMMDDKPLYYR